MPKSIPPQSIKLRRLLLMEYCNWRYGNEYSIYQRSQGWEEVEVSLARLEIDLGMRVLLDPTTKTINIILTPNIDERHT